MSFKISIDRNTQRILDTASSKGLIKEVRKEFSKRGPVKVKQSIIQDMIKGISPVKGGGKYKKYSESYKKQIRKRTSSAIRSSNPTKSISPINLRLSGDLHRSLRSFSKGKTLFIQFKHFLADIHNRLGAGKSKVIRRILPTNSGEKFNRKINTVLLNEIKKAVDKVAKRFSGQ